MANHYDNDAINYPLFLQLIMLLLLLLVMSGYYCSATPIDAATHTNAVNRGKLGHNKYHHRHRVKMQFDTSKEELFYGENLPSFAFDYSEFFVSAFISRYEEGYFLTVLLLGHQLIHEDYPIEAISTDQETLLAWHEATRSWGSHPFDISSQKRNYFCNLHNQDGAFHKPYTAPANFLKLHGQSAKKTNLNRHIEALRCKIKVTKSMLAYMQNSNNKTYSEIYKNKRLYVDIMRRNETTHSRQLIISFTIPWLSRYTGYPSYVQPVWSRTVADIDLSAKLPITSLYHNAGKNITAQQPAIAACISNVRIARSSGRAENGIAMLRESITNLLLQGVRYIVVGILATKESPKFFALQKFLQDYISQGYLTLIPTAMGTFEDVAGFKGIQLKDSFADVFFYNYCLQTLRTASDYILLIRAQQFVFSGKNGVRLAEAIGSGNNKFMEKVEGDRFTGRFQASTKKSGNYEKAMNKQPCYAEIAYNVGCSDDADALFAFGPGDLIYARDYYKSNNCVGLPESYMNVKLFNTKETKAIDVSEQGEFLAVCRNTALLDNGTSVVYKQIIPSSVLYTATFQEAFPSKNTTDGFYKLQGKELEAILTSNRKNFELVHNSLKTLSGYSYILMKEIQEHQDSLKKILSSEAAKEKLLSRADIKPPLWQKCDTQRLIDVINRIYGK